MFQLIYTFCWRKVQVDEDLMNFKHKIYYTRIKFCSGNDTEIQVQEEKRVM